MKIAMVTVHKANNYGAILQAYALQQTLLNFGEVEIVDYENEYLTRTLDTVRFSFSFHGLLGTGKDLFRVVPRSQLVRKFKKFISEHYLMTKPYTQKELLENKLFGFDYYVIGSDQVWNSVCINEKSKLDPVYFLAFAPEGAKKISYASSVGGYLFSGQERVSVKKYLDSFLAISVREKNTQKYLGNITVNEVEHVLDPTLLLEKSQWRKLVKPPVSDEPYLLLYTVPKVPLVRAAVNFFSKKFGLRVIAIDQGLLAGARVDELIRDAGPEEFLALFLGAKFIITDSFHGVCFSVNLERPFVALSPGEHANRVESLLSLVGLSDRFAAKSFDYERLSLSIDFTEPRLRLEKARNESKKFLHKALLN